MWPCETCEKLVPYGSELHYLAKDHVKQALRNLRGICVACSIELNSPSAVKLHLKQKKHFNKVKSGYYLSRSVDDERTCGLCALHFNNQLGWEVHQSSTIHQDALGVTELPRVNALVEYLSGVPTRPSNPAFCTQCNLCDESCEGLDEFVWHLLSKEHLQQLKVCLCKACKKYLSVMEVASHLRSQTHLDAMLKGRASYEARGHGAVQGQLGSLSGFGSDEVHMSVDGTIVEGTSAADLERNLWFSGGYGMLDSLESQGWWDCRHCLIACRSWQAFAVHLRDKFHADNLPRWWTVPIQHGEAMYPMYDSRMVACCKTPLQLKAMPACSLPMAKAWERWKLQGDVHSAWCHLCGVVLNTPHLVEQHLVNHFSDQKQKTRLAVGGSGRMTSPEPVRVEEKAKECAEILQCRSCSVSFCNELGLTVHIALKQHQRRCSNSTDLDENSGEWCESCGVTALCHGLLETAVGLQDARFLLLSSKCDGQEAVEIGLEQIHSVASCGDSFCTRDGCCEVQPLLIELSTSPGEDTGDTASAPFGSPNSIAQRKLSSLARNVAAEDECFPALTPPIYKTRDFMRALCAESLPVPKEGIDEESKNKQNCSDVCALSLSVSFAPNSMGPDQCSAQSKKRIGADGNSLQLEFQRPKQIKFMARDLSPQL